MPRLTREQADELISELLDVAHTQARVVVAVNTMANTLADQYSRDLLDRFKREMGGRIGEVVGRVRAAMMGEDLPERGPAEVMRKIRERQEMFQRDIAHLEAWRALHCLPECGGHWSQACPGCRGKIPDDFKGG